MSDLVKRLRRQKYEPYGTMNQTLCDDAADEIERLQKENKVLEMNWNGAATTCSLLHKEIERLREERNAARNDALEEAAKVCDDARVAWAQKHGNPVTNPFDAGHTSAYLLAADAIRAMKGKENSDE